MRTGGGVGIQQFMFALVWKIAENWWQHITKTFAEYLKRFCKMSIVIHDYIHLLSKYDTSLQIKSIIEEHTRKFLSVPQPGISFSFIYQHSNYHPSYFHSSPTWSLLKASDVSSCVASIPVLKILSPSLLRRGLLRLNNIKEKINRGNEWKLNST